MMKKYAYLAKLEELLEALPAQERQDALDYYQEYFDAANAEDSAAAGLDDPAEVAKKILEGEGLLNDPPKPAEGPEETPEPVTPPAAPEPPRVDPGYTAAAIKTRRRAPKFWREAPKPFSLRGWHIFLLVIIAGILVQVILIGFFACSANAPTETSTCVAESVASVEAIESVVIQGTTENIGSFVNPGSSSDTEYIGVGDPNVNNICIDVQKADVRIVVDPEIESVCFSFKNLPANVTVEGNTLSINSYDAVTQNASVSIKVPERQMDSVMVYVESGSIYLGDLGAECVQIYQEEGGLRAGELNVQDLYISNSDTAEGDIFLTRLYAADSVDILTEHGDVYMALEGTPSNWNFDVTSKGELYFNEEAKKTVQTISSDGGDYFGFYTQDRADTGKTVTLCCGGTAQIKFF